MDDMEGRDLRYNAMGWLLLLLILVIVYFCGGCTVWLIM